ncbi:hypothetical protein N7488_011492 [Penicillium malachiteum]|nr:hypothetical protein N7488_011492 [Penicillium malachiteum]
MTFVSPQDLIVLDEEITPSEHYRDMVERRPQEQKYDLQREVMLTLLRLRDENMQSISSWYAYTLESGAWKETMTEEGFHAQMGLLGEVGVFLGEIMIQWFRLYE